MENKSIPEAESQDKKSKDFYLTKLLEGVEMLKIIQQQNLDQNKMIDEYIAKLIQEMEQEQKKQQGEQGEPEESKKDQGEESEQESQQQTSPQNQESQTNTENSSKQSSDKKQKKKNEDSENGESEKQESSNSQKTQQEAQNQNTQISDDVIQMLKNLQKGQGEQEDGVDEGGMAVGGVSEGEDGEESEQDLEGGASQESPDLYKDGGGQAGNVPPKDKIWCAVCKEYHDEEH